MTLVPHSQYIGKWGRDERCLDSEHINNSYPQVNTYPDKRYNASLKTIGIGKESVVTG